MVKHTHLISLLDEGVGQLAGDELVYHHAKGVDVTGWCVRVWSLHPDHLRGLVVCEGVCVWGGRGGMDWHYNFFKRSRMALVSAS